MMQHHKYSLTELEIYLGLLEEHIKKENERIEQEQAQMRRK